MRTSCAFHQGQYITQFCKCPTCLLPLCQQCIGIHRKQHTSIPQPIDIVPIQFIVNEVGFSIKNQFKYIDAITIQTINKYRESEEEHKKLFQQIMHHKDILTKTIHITYENILQELENNARRRDAWFRQFNLSVLDLKQELASLTTALSGQKYLRTVIMWNRMKPNTTIEQICLKAEKQWLMPSFIGCNQQMLATFITNNTNLKVLEIEGDSGVQKILNMIRVLRYGQEEAVLKNSKASNLSTINLQNPGPNFHGSAIHTSSAFNQNVAYIPPQIPNSPKPLYFSPSNRKNSSKKLQVLSTLEQFKTHSYINENDK